MALGLHFWNVTYTNVVPHWPCTPNRVLILGKGKAKSNVKECILK